MPMDVFVGRFKRSDLAEIAYNHHETVRKVSARMQSCSLSFAWLQTHLCFLAGASHSRL